MRKYIKILRKQQENTFWQTFCYDTNKSQISIAQALLELNQRSPLKDIEGKEAEPIQWECNCQQGKCGACAMLIDGFPALACEEKLDIHMDTVELMPLQKFPVVKDLIVDRSSVFENLKKMQVWIKGKSPVKQENQKEAYCASQCLQCGCCLEICTSYTGGDEFLGMAVLAPSVRIFSVSKGKEKDLMLKKYRRYVYEGCDEFHACDHVCPVKLPLAQLMAHMNAQIKKAVGGDRNEE